MVRVNKPKILFIDLESLPNILYAYDVWQGSKPDMIIKERSIITFSYKWLGDKSVQGLIAKAPYNDYDLVVKIVKLLEEADYVVAHYGDKFDLRFIRARAAIHGITCVPAVNSIDTYKLVKKYFNLNANRLDYLGKLFGFGGKISTGWKLWQECAEGNKVAINKMLAYNKRDVELLEKVFLHILPNVETKLNYKLFNAKSVCPACGSSNVQRRGTIVTKVYKRQRYHCTKCGSWHIGEVI